MITIKNLTKVYETTNYNVVALSNLNFSFVRGEVVVILGRSGSGKTTFLNVLGGFDNTYSGSYFLDQYEFKTMTEAQIDTIRSKRIGFVFQHQVLFNHLSVVENVEIALNVLGVTNEKKKRLNAMKALTLVGLRRHAYKKPWQLSGGEKQRVAIARALIKDPDIIICDEPTAALDSVTSKEILDLLSTVCKNKLLIIATHNKSIVKNYGTRIIELRSGYVVRDELVKDDKSNIKVDDIDHLIDDELYGDNSEVVSSSEQEVLIEAEKNSQILRDLQLDLKNFSQRNEEVFYIDSKEKERVVKLRREKFTEDESFDTFDRVIETITNEKKYAFFSFLYKIRSYVFLSFFLISFLMIMLVGFNSINEVFVKGDNTHQVNYQIVKNNQLLMFNELKTIQAKYSIEEGQNIFIKNNHINGINQNAYQVILDDPSFIIRKNKSLYLELQDYLNTKGYSNSYAIYYDKENVFVETTNDTVLFESLKTSLSPYHLTNRLTLTSVTDQLTETSLNYLYIENTPYIMDYLIKDSQIPKTDDEVLVSVETLLKLGIIGDVNSSDITKIYEGFKDLDDEKKIITINQVKLSKNEAGELNEELVNQTFKIVGLFNAGEHLSSFYREADVPTFIFSKKASDKLNIDLDKDSNMMLIPHYMEVNQKVYSDLDLENVIENFETSFLEKEYQDIFNVMDPIIETYEEGMYELYNEVLSQSSLTGNSFNNFLNKKIEDVTYKTLFDTYLNYFLDQFSQEEIQSFCKEARCNTTTYKDNMKNVILQKQNHLITNHFLASLKNPESLSYELTINTIIYNNYEQKFNPYRLNRTEEVQNLTFESNIESGPYIQLEQELTNFIQTKSEQIKNPELLAKTIVKYGGNSLVNPNALMTSMTSTSSTVVIIVIMYLLSIIITNLFGSIYQLFFINRRREFGSLRILGAKFDDIRGMIHLENKYMLRFSYLFILVVLISFTVIGKLTESSRFFMIYLYDSASNSFTNFSFLNLFSINILTIINVLILMRVIFKKQLIDENINKKLKDTSTLESMNHWDGE